MKGDRSWMGLAALVFFVLAAALVWLMLSINGCAEDSPTADMSEVIDESTTGRPPPEPARTPGPPPDWRKVPLADPVVEREAVPTSAEIG